MRTCSLCNKTTEANGLSLTHFGEWMEKRGMRVHYYCLLLSTHLPQRGKDRSGILGFLMRDIRQEIALAQTRECKYCFEMSASIQCCTCKKYFHLTCGHTSRCLSQFLGEFKSYSHDCVPVDQYEIELFARRPSQTTEVCFICKQIMLQNATRWIYSKCCGSGFTHSKCMKTYALSAGYYLSCIWCKDKCFREDIKYQGVFVPDREANWEKEKGAYV
ncbi:pineapple eye protein-like [Calliphora vicina]|uniref:pineapple eye protein-like n=1 Tax=Calliphora vicina TaxID=7373 RepID=UPI00325AE0AA